MSKIVWVAEMHTEHYDFIAVGGFPEEAVKALAARWNKHAKNVNASSGVKIPKWEDGEGASATVGEYYGMWVRPMKPGTGYMDSESERKD